MLLMTETNLDVFHAQLLARQDAPAMDQLCAACGTPGGPDTAALLQTNAVLGDYAGTDTLQAAMAKGTTTIDGMTYYFDPATGVKR